MKTENMKVKLAAGRKAEGFTEGKFYDVQRVNDCGGGRFRFELLIDSDTGKGNRYCWMPLSMKNGDKSASGRFELLVEEDVTAKNNDISDAIQYSIDCASRAGVVTKASPEDVSVYGAGFEIGFGEVEIQPENGLIKQHNDDGTVSYFLDIVHRSPLSERSDQVTNREVLEELRNVLRCPEGANIVIWAEILAAGYFGDKHPKGGAVEDAIHYKKMGAYSDEALAKILAAIVNDGTNC